jgi:hypothetical protein
MGVASLGDFDGLVPQQDRDIGKRHPSKQQFNSECVTPSVCMSVLDFCQCVQFLERSLIIANTPPHIAAMVR